MPNEPERLLKSISASRCDRGVLNPAQGASERGPACLGGGRPRKQAVPARDPFEDASQAAWAPGTPGLQPRLGCRADTGVGHLSGGLAARPRVWTQRRSARRPFTEGKEAGSELSTPLPVRTSPGGANVGGRPGPQDLAASTPGGSAEPGAPARGSEPPHPSSPAGHFRSERDGEEAPGHGPCPGPVSLLVPGLWRAAERAPRWAGGGGGRGH